MSYPFPHSPLEPRETIPPITAAHAERLQELIGLMTAAKLGDFVAPAAICIAVFQGPITRWLVDDEQVTDTIGRLENALQLAEHGTVGAP